MDDEDLTARLRERLVELVGSIPGIAGGLVASLDGYPLVTALDDLPPGPTAAVVASSCALGARLTDLAGKGSFREVVAHSDDGYVVLYTVGARGVLAVIARPAVNLARLHLNARDVVGRMAPLVDALTDPAG
jgi:hypothetical protein